MNIRRPYARMHTVRFSTHHPHYTVTYKDRTATIYMNDGWFALIDGPHRPDMITHGWKFTGPMWWRRLKTRLFLMDEVLTRKLAARRTARRNETIARLADKD